jgi:TolB protein
LDGGILSANLLFAKSVSLAVLSASWAAATDMVFSANPFGSWHLFLYKADIAAMVQLTDGDTDEHSPVLSPDGEKLVFVTSDGSLSEMTLATGRRAVIPLRGGRHGHPIWMPDGSGIVFTKYISDGFNEEDADFYSYSFAERKEVLFLKQSGPQDYPALSPDFRRLAYASIVITLIPGLEGIINQVLWIADLRRGTALPLLPNATQDRQPVWSRDGRRIAFCSERSGRPNIWITSVEGRDLEQLTHDPASATSPAWSPDSKEIAYISTASGHSELMIINIQSRATRKILPFGNRPVEIRDPQWR